MIVYGFDKVLGSQLDPQGENLEGSIVLADPVCPEERRTGPIPILAATALAVTLAVSTTPSSPTMLSTNGSSSLRPPNPAEESHVISGEEPASPLADILRAFDEAPEGAPLLKEDREAIDRALQDEAAGRVVTLSEWVRSDVKGKE